MSIKITAPSPVDGVQSYGPHQIEFTKGVAEVDELALGVEMYMREHGYNIDREPGEPSPADEADDQIEPAPPVTDTIVVGDLGPKDVQSPEPEPQVSETKRRRFLK